MKFSEKLAYGIQHRREPIWRIWLEPSKETRGRFENARKSKETWERWLDELGIPTDRYCGKITKFNSDGSPTPSNDINLKINTMLHFRTRWNDDPLLFHHDSEKFFAWLTGEELIDYPGFRNFYCDFPIRSSVTTWTFCWETFMLDVDGPNFREFFTMLSPQH